MAGKTYLQLINLVIINLRETQVSTSAQSAFSSLIGQFVNQAKEQVEDSWTWNALTTELSFLTVADQLDYIVDGTGSPAVTSSTGRYCNERSSVIKDKDDNAMVFDLTDIASSSLRQMVMVPRGEQIKQAYIASAQSRQLPYWFSYTFENQIPTLHLHRKPDTSRSLKAWFTIPQNELSLDTDILMVPWRPVVSLATALALEERGEELGQDSPIYFSRGAAQLVAAQNLDADQSELQLISRDA